jgi:hypothetical protein
MSFDDVSSIEHVIASYSSMVSLAGERRTEAIVMHNSSPKPTKSLHTSNNDP